MTPVRLLRLVLLLPALAWGAAAAAEPIPVTARPVALDPTDARHTDVDRLRYRGGLEITSDDARLGGLSGLLISPDGRYLTSVSDQGLVFTARLDHGPDGDLAGLGEATLTPLRDPDGDILDGKLNRDAESLAVDDRGRVLVALEHRHRLLAYDSLDGPAENLMPPRQIMLAPRNDGIEALTRLADGRLLAITEGFRTQHGVIGWVGRPRDWAMLTWETDGLYSPTGATTLADGSVLVLERHYSLMRGTSVRLRRAGATAFQPGARIAAEGIARLAPPLTVDNMEGIAARQGADGETLIYLISDDNFSDDQRTLLLLFELLPADGG